MAAPTQVMLRKELAHSHCAKPDPPYPDGVVDDPHIPASACDCWNWIPQSIWWHGREKAARPLRSSEAENQTWF